MKTCTKCGVEKPIEEFVKNKNCKIGYEGICKKCSSQYKKKYAGENIEKIKTYQKKRREIIKSKKPLKEKKTIEEKRKMRCEVAKRYRERNLEKCKQRCNDYKSKNKESLEEYRKKYVKSEHGINVLKEYHKTEKYKQYKKERKKSESNQKYLKSDKRKDVANRYRTKKYITKQIGETPPPELVEVKLLINKTKRLCKTLKS